MKVIISGYYGFGNAGDEALLSGMLAALAAAAPGAVDVTVLSADPEGTRRLHGVDAVGRQDLGPIWRALKGGTDLFISGGGGLLQDATSRRSALYYLGMIRLAHLAGVPVYLYGQGVGPIRSRSVRVAARRVLRRVAGAGARDAASARLLAALGADPRRVAVTADPAFALTPSDPAEQAALLERFGIPLGRRPLLGIVWRRPLANGEAARGVVEAVAPFARSIRAGVTVITLQPGVDDREGDEFARALADAGVLFVHRPGGRLDHRSLRILVEAMDMNVCVRYHGLLFSALGGVPAVGLAYDEKVRHLAHTLKLPCFPFPVDAGAVRRSLQELWEKAGAVGARLRQTVRTLRGRAMAEAARCLACAKGGPVPETPAPGGPASRGRAPEGTAPHA